MSVLLIGASSTTIRLAEELVRTGAPVHALVLADSPQWMLDELTRVGAGYTRVAQVREDELADAGIDFVTSVVVIGLDEMTTVRVALMVEELNPDARIVLELDNPDFGRRLAPLLGSCTAMSAAALAAPSFVAAAFPGGLAQPVHIGGRNLAAGRDERVGGEVLAVLGEVREDDVDLTLPERGNVVLATKVLSDGPVARRRGLWGALLSIIDRRLRWVLGTLLVLVALSTVFFHVAAGMDWLTALYVALTASTLTGMGEDLSSLPLATRVVGVLVQLVGLVITSGITAVIVDALISSRLGRAIGEVGGRPKGHYVVVGLGRVGVRVATALAERGLSVVAVERREEAPGVGVARERRIPVVIGESLHEATLRRAGVERAQALVTVTDSDAANLQVALSAKAVNPDVRVVTRMFDDDLAERVERQLDTGPTRSVSRLAAPMFAAAAVGRAAEVVVPVGRRVVVLAELQVERPAVVDDLVLPGQSRVLAVRHAGSWTWHPAATTALRVGDRVAVAATRFGMARVAQMLGDG